MRWLRAPHWRPLTVALGLVLLMASIGYAAPAPRPGPDMVLRQLAKRWAPEALGQDECSVVSTDRIGKLLDADVRLTERELRPTGDGWEVRCGYGEGRLGLATATTTVVTEVNPKRWEPEQRPSERSPIRLDNAATVGDETYITLRPGPDSSTQVRIEARQGRSVVRLEYFAPVRESGAMPNPVPGLQLVRDTLSHASSPTYTPGALPTKAYAGCERVDRSLAAKALGGKLNAARTTYERDYRPNGDLHCEFAGERAELAVTVWHQMDAEAYLEPLQPNLHGIGNRAAFDATVLPDGQPRLQATIRAGDRIVSVDGGYADRENVDRRKPTEAERALLESLVRSLK